MNWYRSALVVTVIAAALLVSMGCSGGSPTPAALSEPVAPVEQVPVETAPAAEEPATGQQDEATWDELLATWIAPDSDRCDAPGGVLLVDSPAGRYLKAAGVASTDDERPVEVGDRFEIGSNTKSFTVALALQLQEEGVLSMDDLLSKWLPDLASRIPNGDEITLREMAGNTSGIWDFADPLIQPMIDANDQEGLVQAYIPEELVEYAIANGSPEFDPGSDWSYSSTNFVLLGMVVEAATGQKLGELYEERIFGPLGLESSSYLVSSPEPGSIVDGYYTLGSGEVTDVTDWNGTQGGAAGAIVSTAEDMAGFADGLMTGRLFQSEDTLGEMLALRQVESSLFKAYGLGIGSFNSTGFNAVGHAGQTPGFETVWFYVPEAETLLILLANSGSCPVDFLPLLLTPEMFGLDAAADEASADTSTDQTFPRPEPDYDAKRVRDFSAFEDALAAFEPERAAALDTLLTGKTVLDIQRLLDDGELSSEELVTYYVDRIQRYDVDKLNSVMELNPEALEIARTLDAERADSGARGQMHGIPLLLKDNIAAGDKMQATAGAYAMKDWTPDRDGFMVKALRDNGAIIMGKANLSEWANYMDPDMPSGFSSLGGQTRNPYGPYEVWGSSSGSAVAAAAGLSAVTVGTETQGSILMPAGVNSVVGLKTSRGLVSGDYVIPLMDWMDTPGPMGRTVTDVAVLLTAMTAPDPDNPEASELAQADFTQYLDADAASGLRVGLIVESEEIKQVFTNIGMEVVQVDPEDIPDAYDARPALEYGFQDSLNRFLASVNAPVKTLADVVAINDEDLTNRAPFGQGFLEGSVGSKITQEEYDEIKAENSQSSVDAITALFENYDIDVLMSDANQRYAPAGFPAISVPAGYAQTGEPVPVTFTALYLGEGELLAVAYAFEQAAHARQEPNLDATLSQIEEAIEANE